MTPRQIQVLDEWLDPATTGRAGAEEREAVRALRLEHREMREALHSLGYHAPGQCRHGLEKWAGSHCLFDMPALGEVDRG